MPLFGSKHDSSTTDPQLREVEKMINSEAKDDQKTLDRAVKDLKKAEASHTKGIKVSASPRSQRAPPMSIRVCESLSGPYRLQIKHSIL